MSERDTGPDQPTGADTAPRQLRPCGCVTEIPPGEHNPLPILGRRLPCPEHGSVMVPLATI